MAAGSFFWPSVRPRLLTVVKVSRVKHRRRTLACVVASSLERPERVRYACH